jgi:hypothetical protein
MKSTIKLLIALLLLSHLALAQPGPKNSVNVSTGLEMLLPSSDFSNRYSLGAGASVKGEYVFAKHISATASFGYLRMPGKDLPDFQMLPVLGGVRYYVGNFYIGAETGYGFALRNGEDNGLMYVLSVGDEIIVSRRNRNSIDISARVQRWNVQSNVLVYGLRVAYEFRLN